MVFFKISTSLCALPFDDSTCGTEKYCLKTDSESAIISIKPFTNDQGINFIDVELYAPVLAENSYIALGFSSGGDVPMENSYVSECSQIIGEAGFTPKLSWNNDQPANERIGGLTQDQMKTILLEESIQSSDGGLYCSFRQQITGVALNNQQIYNYTNGDQKLVLIAKGSTKETGLNKHSGRDINVADAKIDVMNPLNLPTTQPPTTTGGAPFDDSACGKEKYCLKTDSESAIISIKPFTDNQGINFLDVELYAPVLAENSYIALGLSSGGDVPMENSYVSECSQIIGEADFTPKLSWNDDQPSNERIEGLTVGFKQDQMNGILLQPSVRKVDGGLYCSFRQQITGVALNNQQIYNYTNGDQKLVLIAKGKTKEAGLTKHSNKDIKVADAKIDVMNPLNLPTTQPSPFTHNAGVKFVDVELYAPTLAEKSYIAFGLSEGAEPAMANSFVSECSQIDDEADFSPKLSWNNENPSNERIDGLTQEQMNGILLESSVRKVDGGLYCSFRQQITNVALNNPKIYNYTDGDLKLLLVAKGLTRPTGLSKHRNGDTGQGIAKIDVMNPLSVQTTQMPTGTTATSGPTIFDPSTCGTEKYCFFPKNDPDPTKNFAVASIKFRTVDNTSYLDVELFTNDMGENKYLALGISEKQDMANSFVSECSALGGANMTAKLSYNDNQPANLRIDGLTQANYDAILTNVTVTTQDGQLYCSYTQQLNNLPLANDMLYTYKDGDSRYLLIAKGLTSGSGLLQHVGANKAFTQESIPLANSTHIKEKLFDASTCGLDKYCFFPCATGAQDPDSCFAVASLKSTTINGTGYLDIELYSGNLESTGQYIALGFSKDGGMANDMGTILKTPSIKSSDGRVYCSFRQQLTNLPINVPKDDKDNDEVYTYKQGDKRFLIMAVGKTDANGLLEHNANGMAASNVTVDLGDIPPHPNGADTFDDSGCAVNKTCLFGNGAKNSKDAFAAASWTFRNESGTMYLDIELYSASLASTSSYVAMAFGTSGSMANTYVTECSALSGAARSPKLSYNNGNPRNVRISGLTNADYEKVLTKPTIVASDGSVYCRFTQQINNLPLENNQVYSYDGKKMFVMLAKGTAGNDGLTKHGDKDTVVTSEAMDLTLVLSANAKDTRWKERLIKAHAIMMVLAWFCFVPTAVFFARFMRDAWPDYKPMGLLIWFHVHRTCNMLGIILMIASLCCILTAYKWKWTGPSPTAEDAVPSWAQKHTAIGLTAIILAFVQPLISTMRCDPKNPRRPYFNWVHRLIGVAAMVLATTAFGFAAYKKLGVAPKGLYIVLEVLPFTCLLVLSLLFLLIERCVEVTPHNLSTVRNLRYSSVFVTEILLVGISIAFCVFIGQTN
ncbi:unnamed protein product, partial [Mesorhabditis spiculigera]